MYKEKKKIYFLIALIIWILRAIGLLIMGILHKNGVENYNAKGDTSHLHLEIVSPFAFLQMR